MDNPDLGQIRPPKPRGLQLPPSRSPFGHLEGDKIGRKNTSGVLRSDSPEVEDLERVAAEEKSTFSLLFASLAVLLVLLPFVTTFNELLTRIVENVGWYRAIQDYIVPILTRMVYLVLKPFGLNVSATNVGLLVNGASVRLSWNCLGWQSIILFLISLLTGLQGPYTKISKLECFLIGILGTFFVNLLRISGIVLISTYISRIAAIIFHDYGSNILIIIWLFFFWWFSFRFVLERQSGKSY